MANKSKLFKVLLTIFVFGFMIWLGGTIFRTTIAYNLFQLGHKMFLKPEYTNMERINTIYIFSTTSLLTGIAYGFAAVSSIILAFMIKQEFKQRGWLFICFCLFVFTMPVQAYFIYMDWGLAQAVYYNKILDFYHPDIQKFFVHRFQDVTNASMRSLMLLASFTCVLYSVWRPLDNKDKKTDNLQVTENNTN